MTKEKVFVYHLKQDEQSTLSNDVPDQLKLTGIDLVTLQAIPKARDQNICSDYFVCIKDTPTGSNVGTSFTEKI